MQFDPGMEYRPDWGVSKPLPAAVGPSGRIQRGASALPHPQPKDDKSWLLLCSALTDGPYSYIWTSETNRTKEEEEEEQHNKTHEKMFRLEKNPSYDCVISNYV